MGVVRINVEVTKKQLKKLKEARDLAKLQYDALCSVCEGLQWDLDDRKAHPEDYDDKD